VHYDVKEFTWRSINTCTSICGAPWHSSIRNVKIANIGLSLVAQDVVIVGAVITRKSNQKDSGWKKLFTIRDLSPISYHLRYDELDDTDRLGNENHYEKITVVDVFWKVSEPTCNYLGCHHKFSVHGDESHICKCRHPQNRIIGMSSSI